MSLSIAQEANTAERGAKAISISGRQRDRGVGTPVHDEMIFFKRNLKSHFGLVADVSAGHPFEFGRGRVPALDLFVVNPLIDLVTQPKTFASGVEFGPGTVFAEAEHVVRDRSEDPAVVDSQCAVLSLDRKRLMIAHATIQAGLGGQ